MKIERILITPEIAKEYLEHNFQDNRKVVQSRVNAYAADMASGAWEEDNPQNMITFWPDGTLINGQHRLHAIIENGVSIHMYVAHADRNVYMFDAGGCRSVQDRLRMKGRGADVANGSIPAIISKVFECIYDVQIQRHPLTTSIMDYYVEKFGAELVTADSIARSGGGDRLTNNAPVKAGIYTAYRLSFDEDLLREFIKIVNTGIPNHTWQTAPLHLRNFLLKPENKSANTSTRRLIVNVTLKALEDFEAKKARKTSYENVKNNDTYLKVMLQETDADIIAKYKIPTKEELRKMINEKKNKYARKQ